MSSCAGAPAVAVTLEKPFGQGETRGMTADTSTPSTLDSYIAITLNYIAAQDPRHESHCH